MNRGLKNISREIYLKLELTTNLNNSISYISIPEKDSGIVIMVYLIKEVTNPVGHSGQEVFDGIS